jgi:hypothetical protein
MFKSDSVCSAAVLVAAISLGLGGGGKAWQNTSTDTVINADTNTSHTLRWVNGAN